MSIKQCIFSFLFLGKVCLLLSLNHNSKHEPRLCILFERDTDYISVEFEPDSITSEFTIVKEGFETEEKRKQAVEEYFKNQRGYYPVFYVFYYSLSKPVTVQSMNAADCSDIVTVNELRSKKLYSSRVYFIEKKSAEMYLIWKAVLEPEE